MVSRVVSGRVLRATAISIALGSSLLLVGCGGDSASEDVVRVEATDSAYEMPDQIEGGLSTMEFVNAGEHVHEWALGRLKEGRLAADLRAELVTSGIESLESIEDVGGVPAMTPGATLRLTRELEPGRYAFFCSMPASRRLAYFQVGMVRGFEVAGTSDAQPPDVDGAITVREESIEVPAIEAGTRTLKLENTANDVRELKLLSLDPGQRPADLEAWFGRRFAGDAPADMLGVLGKLGPGETAYATVDFEAGRTYHLFDQPHGVSARVEVD
jgi:hypothetical protein